MRIAINAVLLSWAETGVEVYIRSLIHYLGKADTRNEYLVFMNGDTWPPEVIAGKNFRAHQTTFTHHQRLRRILWEQRTLPQILAREKVDVLHAPAYVMPLRCPVPCVATMHDILAVSHPQFCRKLNALHYGFMLPRTAQRAARIIASSQATRSAIMERFGVPQEKVSVIYPGVNEEFHPRERTASWPVVAESIGLPKKYILFVGRLEPKKNVSVLLRAYAWLKENREAPHKLVLVGPPECSDRIFQKTMTTLGLGDSVVRMPYLPVELLQLAYGMADVFVFPSLAEGFGFPPLEAMACGTPVVASNIPVLRETLGDAAITVPPDDVNSLAIAIHKVLTNTFLRRTLIQRGRERVRQFNWMDTARKMVALYEEVAAGPQRRS